MNRSRYVAWLNRVNERFSRHWGVAFFDMPDCPVDMYELYTMRTSASFAAVLAADEWKRTGDLVEADYERESYVR